MRIKAALKKHTFLLLACVVIFGCLFFVGYGLSQSIHFIQLEEVTPDKNAIEWLLWRLFLYASIFLLWKPIIRYRVVKNAAEIHQRRLNILLAYRNKMLVVAVIYEVLIVQNLIGTVFGR